MIRERRPRGMLSIPHSAFRIPHLLLLLALCLFAGPASARTQLKPGFNLFSKQQEVELGREAASQTERQLQLVHDAALNSYVSDLGQRLVRYAPNHDFPFTFKVVQDKRINAFALPGGPVYINTGTIEAAENESQVAGVMAHEIGHVVLRHATNNASKAYAYQAPLAVLGGMIGSGGIGAQLAGLAASFGLNSIFLKYSRDAERQADIIGTQIMYDAGYDPGQMARFFAKLQEEEKSRSVEFLSDHPNPGNRVALVRNEMSTLGPPHGATADTGQFPAMHARAADWDRRGGGRSNSFGHESTDSHRHPDMPSGGLRGYNGQGFRISYPDNWQAFEQGTTVALTPNGGVSGNAIAYGALVSSFDPYETQPGRVTLSDATSQLIEQLHQGNPEMRVMGGTRRRVRLNAADGETVTLTGRSPVGGEREIDWLLTALRPDGTLWYVVFIAPERDFGAMRPTFERMLDSVQLVN